MKSGDEVSTGDNFRCAAHRVTCKAPASAPVELRVSTPIDEGPYSKVCESGVPEKAGERARWKGLATVFRGKAIACPEPGTQQLSPSAVEREGLPERAQRTLWFV